MVLEWDSKGTGRPKSGRDIFMWGEVKYGRHGLSALCGISVGSKCVWLLSCSFKLKEQE